MRVLITNERLDRRPGTDLYVRDLARGLQRLGHFVVVYSSDPRHLPRLVEMDAISVIADLQDLPYRPDIIHSRHYLDAYTALLALPDVPAVHHCLLAPGTGPLPVHPRIYRYLAPSAADRPVLTQGGIAEDMIDLLPHQVCLERIQETAEPASTPRRALIFDDRLGLDAALVQTIQEAVEARGLELDTIGRQFGRTIDKPENVLPGYDIVFAEGRSALEAIACGCAVIRINLHRSGGFVDAGNLEDVRSGGGRLADDGEPSTVGEIDAQLSAYSRTRAKQCTQALWASNDYPGFVRRVDAAYAAAIEAHKHSEPDWDAEQRAIGEYLWYCSKRFRTLLFSQRQNGDMTLSSALSVLRATTELEAAQWQAARGRWDPFDPKA